MKAGHSIKPLLAVGLGWMIDVDSKKLFLRPDVAANGGAISGRTNLDPWIIGAGIR